MHPWEFPINKQGQQNLKQKSNCTSTYKETRLIFSGLCRISELLKNDKETHSLLVAVIKHFLKQNSAVGLVAGH